MATAGSKMLNDEQKQTLSRLIGNGLQFVDLPTGCLCCNCGVLPICYDSFRCGHTYCRDCFGKYSNLKWGCTECSGEPNTERYRSLHQKLKIYHLKAFCPNKVSGCTSEVPLYKLLVHLSDCSYSEVRRRSSDEFSPKQRAQKKASVSCDAKASVETMKATLADNTKQLNKMESETKEQFKILMNMISVMDSKYDAILKRFDVMDEMANTLKSIEKNISSVVGKALKVSESSQGQSVARVMPNENKLPAVVESRVPMEKQLAKLAKSDSCDEPGSGFLLLHCQCGAVVRKALNMGFHIAAKHLCACCTMYVCTTCLSTCSKCRGLICLACRTTASGGVCHLCREKRALLRTHGSGDLGRLRDVPARWAAMHQAPKPLDFDPQLLIGCLLRLCGLFNLDNSWEEKFKWRGASGKDYVIEEASMVELKLLLWHYNICSSFDDCVSKDDLIKLVPQSLSSRYYAPPMEYYKAWSIVAMTEVELRVRLDRSIANCVDRKDLMSMICRFREADSTPRSPDRGKVPLRADDIEALSLFDLKHILRFFEVQHDDVISRSEALDIVEDTTRAYNTLKSPLEVCVTKHRDLISMWTLKSTLSKWVRTSQSREELLLLAKVLEKKRR